MRNHINVGVGRYIKESTGFVTCQFAENICIWVLSACGRKKGIWLKICTMDCSTEFIKAVADALIKKC